jgi:hypothetical protein
LSEHKDFEYKYQISQSRLPEFPSDYTMRLVIQKHARTSQMRKYFTEDCQKPQIHNLKSYFYHKSTMVGSCISPKRGEGFCPGAGVSLPK